ncbi:hypothetical protein Cal7507_5549 [Calothrix sp. PCC 7507]|nr:hypothetical protein Cal7507_5549 [Calothrix sp. PCC 7507]
MVGDLNPPLIGFQLSVNTDIAILGYVRYTRKGTALPCPYSLRYNFVPHLNGNRYNPVLSLSGRAIARIPMRQSIQAILLEKSWSCICY